MEENFLKQYNMKYVHKRTGVLVELVELNCSTKFYRPETGVTNHECVPIWIVENSTDWVQVKEEPKYKMVGNFKALRVSDGVEFNLRDVVRQVHGGDTTGPILAFEWVKLGGTDLLVAQVGIYKLTLDNIEKAMLVTEDGVAVFDTSTTIYWLHKILLAYGEGLVKYYDPGDRYLVFSTKEARLHYMAIHKPILSVLEANDAKSKNISLVIAAKEKLRANDSNL